MSNRLNRLLIGVKFLLTHRFMLDAAAATNGRKKHFAKFENNYVYAWSDGKTSWSTTNGSTMVWEHAKLAESEESDGR